MRQIEFRAWDKKEKKMIYATLTELLSDIGYDMPADNTIDFNRKGLEIMQFTGLLDINGKKIFEGDIVRIIKTVNQDNEIMDYYEGMYEVIFHNACFCFSNRLMKDFNTERALESGWYEVIGNIYENPELLEELK